MEDISLISKKEKEQGLPRLSRRERRAVLGGSTKVAMGLLILVLLAGVGLFAYGALLDSQKESLEDERKATIAQRDAVLENRVQTLAALISAYEELVRQHHNWTHIFATIEERTLPEVTLTSLDGEYMRGHLSIEGLAQNYNALARQIRSYEGGSSFVVVDATEVSLTPEGEIGFVLTVSFNPNVTLGPPTQ
jgi:Tfp pilus assembly protein PilN